MQEIITDVQQIFIALKYRDIALYNNKAFYLFGFFFSRKREPLNIVLAFGGHVLNEQYMFLLLTPKCILVSCIYYV